MGQSFAGGLIECAVGPTEMGAAHNLEQEIVDFINGAQKRLDIAVQELDSEPIARAIVDAKLRRKVAVRLVLEQNYLVSDFAKKELESGWLKRRAGEDEEAWIERVVWAAEPETKRAAGGAPPGLAVNRRLLTALLRAGIQVHGDLNPELFHQKFIVRDARGGGGAPALLTGSANFTETDTHKNLNHLVVFHDLRVAEEYHAEFGQISEGEFGRGLQGDVPRTYGLNGVPVKVLFAPDHTPELEFMKQLLKAREQGTVRFAIFTFSGSSGIDDALMALARGGVTVRGVLDPMQNRSTEYSAARWLRHPNIALHLPRSNWLKRKLHHKLAVVDEAIVIAGSFNYTAPANDYNDENLFVIGAPYPKLKEPGQDEIVVDQDECAAIATFFADEIERIIANSDHWQPPPPNP